MWTGAEGREAGAVEAGGGGIGCRTQACPVTFGFLGPGIIQIRGDSGGVGFVSTGFGSIGFGWVGWGGFGLGRFGFGFDGAFTFERPETFLGFEGPAAEGLGRQRAGGCAEGRGPDL